MTMLLAFLLPAFMAAQVFYPLGSLSFTKVYGGANPLPQVVTVAMPTLGSGGAFDFYASVVNGTGGNWLSIDLGSGSYATPNEMTVSVAPVATLAAGTYSASIVIKSYSNSNVTMTVPVSLMVEPSTATFFDVLPGALTFSMQTGGTAPPAQPVTIRNAGAGTLSYTASATTADGGGWLSLSATGGTAPSTLNVSINPAKLPGTNFLSGTFTGQVVLTTGSDVVTIPVSATLGASSVFRQINALSFTKAYGGANPLPQIITATTAVPGTGGAYDFYVSAVNSTGGNWLSVDLGTGSYGTPQEITVIANPAITLAAGTYTAEIILKSYSLNQALVVPVTLAVEAPSATFFDALPGALNFSMLTGGTAPPAQVIPVRRAGTGTLNFTASVSTSDGGNWLSLSAASGAAPYSLSVAIDPTQLPGQNFVDGTFTGQVVLQSGLDVVTIPVTVTLGSAAFRQINGLRFTKTYAGANPLPQVLTVATTTPGTGGAYDFYASVVNSTGGNWLSIDLGTGSYATPTGITVTANPAITLAPGTYTAEILIKAYTGNQSTIVPVTLTIANPATDTYFDAIPGQLTFSMLTGGNTPPSQPIPIRNAGVGTLNFSAYTTTSDGGDWLSLSATSGTAPYVMSVSINPANLPGSNLLDGTFTGQVILTTGNDVVTIPVTVTLGPAAFRQINALNFTKPYAGSNPLPQVVTVTNAVAGTGGAFDFYVSAVNSTGGSWLSVDLGTSAYATPHVMNVFANPAITLAAGTYTAEIILKSYTLNQTIVVPVTLAVEAATDTFFEGVPAALTFSGQANGVSISPLVIPIRNGGAGTLNWTATVSTADGGNWLSISAGNGIAPSAPSVLVNPANLPGKGLIAGSYTGQILLQTGMDFVTVPVTVTLADSVLKQAGRLNFTKTYLGANPATQSITITSTNAAVPFYIAAVNGTGGNWLSVNLGNGSFSTPQGVTVTADPDVALAPGVYTAEISIVTYNINQPLIIPVNLTVTPNITNITGEVTVVSGANQTASVGTSFSSPLVVQVKTAGGTAVPNATVTFSSMGLAFSSATAVTNSAGQASVSATPTLAGVLTVSASVAGGTPFVLFNETGVATASTTPPAFSSMAILATGASASGISPVAVAGDFNGDGLQDLATANLVDASVSVLLGKGNGSFQTAASYGVGHGPYGLATGDFNGDGKLDLAVVNGLDNTVSVLLNKGAGGFAATPSFTYAVGGQPYGVSAADINRDGVLDLIVTNNADKTISVLLGNGDGGFRAQTTYATGGLPFGTAIADMNGDGYPDVIAWNYADNTVSVLLNDRTGRFAAQAVYATGSGPYGVSTGDFNGDGYPDIAVANLGGNTVSVMLNDKTGKLLPAVAYSVGSLPISVLAADLNGDGVLDLTVTSLGDGTISLLLGKGNGTFQPQTTADAGTQPYGVLAADFNGDSRLDLAVTSFFTPSIGVLLQNPSAASIKMKGAPPKKPAKLVPAW